jgi:hypothetical protein
MSTTAAAASATAATATPVTLLFAGLPPALVAELQEATNAAKTRPFLNAKHVEVLRSPEGLVFRMDQGEGGFSFCRHAGENDVETFRHFLHDPIQSLYMPIAYEVKAPNAAVVQGILERYAQFGKVDKIDWIWFSRPGKDTLLLMRIPKEIVQGMMSHHGGVLSTQVRGPVVALRRLPVLAKIVPEDAMDGEIMHRAFVTPYTTGEHEQSMAVHQAALREVIAAGPCGITIGPVAVWTP